ncbi:MAG: hypothetical protein LBG62_03600 [Candidatus Methanoplasma sp.]|jgi:hypothetical protein|nr:hypothetical protein [Candidatus Methanoplasma sp.]
MSFFDNNQNVGLALIVIGLINLIAGIVSAAWEHTGSSIAYGIGSVITGILILLYGIKVRNGSNDKVAIVSGLVGTIGLATILSAIFNAIGAYTASDDVTLVAAIGAVILSIIIGLIYLWVASKIAGANKNVISKIVWVLLLIVSVLGAIGSLIGAISGNPIAIITGLAWFVVYVYVLIAALSNEVKSSMGVN